MDKGFNREKNLDVEYYKSKIYVSQNQFNTFYRQIMLCKSEIDKNKNVNYDTVEILEIGKGCGVTESLLKNYYENVTSCDINSNLKPDIIANIADENLKFPQKYDLILCAEVIEHIPFDSIEIIMNNLNNALNDGGSCIIAIPIMGRRLKFLIDIPKVKLLFHIKKPFNKNMSTMHFWEMNSDINTRKNNLIKMFEKYFNVKDHDIIKENMNQYYFILGKK